MTETSSLYNTHALPHAPSVTAQPTSASPLPNGAYSDTNVVDEEEYTIKCICIYSDDDGNTVYCEQCDTWQHIECYYHGKRVPEVHFCVDCQPRDLDGKRATERQRRAREQLEGGDRKVKRPSSKTSKKKQKEIASSDQVNGWTHHERHDSMSNGRDQPPPAKKPKTSHRTSGSVVSLNGESRKRAHSNLQSYPSPSKSPQEVYRFPFIPQYTPEFLELYDRDDGNTNAEGNQCTISASNHLSRWKTDPSLVVRGLEQQPNNQSPLVYIAQDLQNSSLPRVSLQKHQDTSIELDGRHPTWRFLSLQQPVFKDEIVGEICGEVGMLEEYCQQQSSQNRWTELQHPDPFVFFHPHMNIYIDSRKNGTQFRYLRRSCQPNVTLKTFVTDDGDARQDTRHCFVANQNISAGSELTAAWFINPAMFNMNADRETSEQMDNQRSDWISRVLANFGNCACGDSSQCPWARLDRRSSVKSLDPSIKPNAGRKRKTKSKQAISPTSTGHATNSRAGSEAVKGADEDEDDRRSTSESSRSGPRSRDMTPVNVAVLDADPVLGNRLTDREMRKIQAAEKAFEKREQRAHDDKKKKKRTSGGSNLNTPHSHHSRMLAYSPTQSDTKHFPDSPPLSTRTAKTTSGTRTAHTPRPTYCSVGIQTEPEGFDTELPPTKKVRYVTPVQRLLNKIKADRERCIAHNKPIKTSPSSRQSFDFGSSDVEMKGVGSGMSPTSANYRSPVVSPTPLGTSNAGESSSWPLPSQAAHTQAFLKQSHAPRLHLSTLPPVPTFPNMSNGTPGSAGLTPSLVTPTAQSPLIGGSGPLFGNMITSTIGPSPVKKKMSLGDYMNRRNLVSTPSTEKSQAQAWGDGIKEHRTSSNAEYDPLSEHVGPRPGASIMEEAAKRGGVEDNVIDDTPIKDEGETASRSLISVEQESQTSTNGMQVPHTTTMAGRRPNEVASVFASLTRL